MKKPMDIFIVGSFLTVLIFAFGALVWAIIAEIIDFVRNPSPKPKKQSSKNIKVNGKKQKVHVEHTSDGMVCITTEATKI